MERFLLPSLCELECQYWELAPVILGCEIRRRGRQCFVNYSEYQKYLYYTYTGRFATAFQEQNRQMLTTVKLDYITDYNLRTYAPLAAEIENEWLKKLTPSPRYKARVKWYSVQKGFGFIQTEQGEELRIQKSDIESTESLHSNQVVSFEIFTGKGRRSAVRVRTEMNADSGHAKSGSSVARTHSDAPRAARRQGRVKWFNSKKGYGFITSDDGGEIFVYQGDIEGSNALREDQRVSFEVGNSPKGPKAIRVRILSEE